MKNKNNFKYKKKLQFVFFIRYYIFVLQKLINTITTLKFHFRRKGKCLKCQLFLYIREHTNFFEKVLITLN